MKDTLESVTIHFSILPRRAKAPVSGGYLKPGLRTEGILLGIAGRRKI
jgi:hypothetical protein